MTDQEIRIAVAEISGGNEHMNTIQLAAKLYDARDSMRRFWGEKYPKKVAAYQDHIRAGMRNYNCDEIQTTMKLLTLLQEKLEVSGMQQALLLAAYVEMVEGGAT